MEPTYPDGGERTDYPTQTGEHPGFGRLLLWMGLFVLAGVPFVAYLWETLNELLALEVNAQRLLIAVPVLLGMIGILFLLARAVRRWTDLEHVE